MIPYFRATVGKEYSRFIPRIHFFVQSHIVFLSLLAHYDGFPYNDGELPSKVIL